MKSAKADSQTVIGAFDERRVTSWRIGRARQGNKALPIFLAVQAGPVRTTEALRFPIVVAAAFTSLIGGLVA